MAPPPRVRCPSTSGVARRARTALRRDILAGARVLANVAPGAAMWLARASARRCGVAIMHHRIEPRQGDPAEELLPPLSCAAFADQLEHLRRHYEVVPASDLPDAVRRRRRGGRFPVAVTFDDDLPSHVRWAGPLLRAHGVRATFFLNAATLAGPSPFWWELLQAGLDRGATLESLVPRSIVAALDAGPAGERMWRLSEAIQALPAADRATWTAELRAALPAAARGGLRAADVRRLTAEGFEVGFHTRRHEPLSLLDDAALAVELEAGRADLEELVGRRVELLAYPHGKADARVARAARRAGYRLAYTVRAEAVTPAGDPLLLGRVDGFTPSRRSFARQLLRTLLA